MSTYRRKLVIKTDGLAKGGNLLLTFKPLENIGLMQKKVAWKVISFAKNTPRKAEVEYTTQFAFIGPQVDSGNRVSPSTYKSVKVGGAVKFTFDTDRNLLITDTEEHKMDGFIVATNETGKIQDIAIGLETDPRKDPESILYFHKVGNTSMVVAKVHPILRAYMTSDYEKSEVISGEIQTKMIWERDLTLLDEITNWRVTYDHESGSYSLSPEDGE